jgi:hypothetical protein
MNDTISLLLATAVLAVGGVGLYIYKTSDDDIKKGGSKNKNKHNDFFQTGNQDDYLEDENDYEEDDDEHEDNESKVRARNVNSKTKRNKRNTGTKRRY